MTEPAQQYAHKVVPEPPAGAPLADFALYHLTRAQGFYAAMVAAEEADIAEAVRRYLPEAYLAFLLYELSLGHTPQDALDGARRVLGWEDAQGEVLWERLRAAGIDPERIRAYRPTRVAPERGEAHHWIEWSFTHGVMYGTVHCNAPEGADCRLTCDHPGAECESWSTPERDEDGPFHLATEYADDEACTETEIRHRMADAGYCNVVEWLNADPGLLPELFSGGPFDTVKHPIEPVWEGEGYGWKPVPAATGVQAGICRVCGCTDAEACPGGCWWAEYDDVRGDLCSSCPASPAVADDTTGDEMSEKDVDNIGELSAELVALCSDSWLRRRDRYMGLGPRLNDDAAGAAERCAHDLRTVLQRFSLLPDERGAAYLEWVRAGRPVASATGEAGRG